MQFVRVGEDSEPQYRPLPWPPFAEFPEIVQFVRVGEELQQQTPQPSRADEFPEIVQFIMVVESEAPQKTPPPQP